MPHLERGRPRKARAEAGAAPHELVHRSVDELHINLPFEITEKRKELAALEDKVRTNEARAEKARIKAETCLLYTSPSPRDLSTSRMPSSA